MDVLTIEYLRQQLDRIEASVDLLICQRTVKDFYSTAEVAKLVDRAEFTVREWCRPVLEWMIPHSELVRYQSYGLVPESRR